MCPHQTSSAPAPRIWRERKPQGPRRNLAQLKGSITQSPPWAQLPSSPTTPALLSPLWTQGPPSHQSTAMLPEASSRWAVYFPTHRPVSQESPSPAFPTAAKLWGQGARREPGFRVGFAFETPDFPLYCPSETFDPLSPRPSTLAVMGLFICFSFCSYGLKKNLPIQN